MHASPVLQQPLEANDLRIILYQERLSVILDCLVRRIESLSTGISHDTPLHPVDLKKTELGRPKSAACTQKDFVPWSLRLQGEFGASVVSVQGLHSFVHE